MRQLTGGRAWWLTALCAGAVIAVAAACASMGMPTGGPKDKAAPVLKSLTPDTNARRVKAKDVVFSFDEVVSERPKTVPTLEQLVVISPAEGLPEVEWQRSKLVVHLRKGWRPNTAYTVTLLPGLMDLSGNVVTKPLQTVFTTGDDIPRGVVRGVVFDWVGQKVAVGARLEATIGADTLLRWVAATDSAGRFSLPNVPPADVLHLKVYIDQNSNRRHDRREAWDSTTIALADSSRRDFYLFAHDSIPPRMAEVTLVDSTALRIKFDRPLSPAAPLDVSQFVLLNKDSTVRAIGALYSVARYDSLAIISRRARDDSAAKADTTKAARTARAKADSTRAAAVKDSIAQAQIDAAKAARDTAKREPPPKPERAAPLADVILQLAVPLKIGDSVRVKVSDLVALDGMVRKADSKLVFRPKPPPKDTTAAKRGAGQVPGAPGKPSGAAAKPPATARDSAAAKAAAPAVSAPRKPLALLR